MSAKGQKATASGSGGRRVRRVAAKATRGHDGGCTPRGAGQTLGRLSGASRRRKKKKH